MNENYRRARAYLYKFTSTEYNDILHDAFLTYYRRTGLNLFERTNFNVIGVVRNQYYESLRKDAYVKNGVRYFFQHQSFEDYTSYNSTTPHDLLIGKEAYETIVRRTKQFDAPDIAQAVLDLRIEGYNTREIAEQLGLTPDQVNTYTTNLGKDRPGKNRLSEKERVEIVKLSKSGLTLNQIVNKTGRSIRTVWKAVNGKY